MPGAVPDFHQTSAGLLVQGARLLLCHRRPDRLWYPDVWDLVGGHVEPGETPAGALVREAREELGIEIRPPRQPIVRWLKPDLDLVVFRVTEWSGQVRNLAVDEHDEIGWFTLAEVRELALPDPIYLPFLEQMMTSPG